MGVVLQAAAGLSKARERWENLDVRGRETHLIARLYGAGQFDGVSKLVRVKRKGGNT